MWINLPVDLCVINLRPWRKRKVREWKHIKPAVYTGRTIFFWWKRVVNTAAKEPRTCGDGNLHAKMYQPRVHYFIIWLRGLARDDEGAPPLRLQRQLTMDFAPWISCECTTAPVKNYGCQPFVSREAILFKTTQVQAPLAEAPLCQKQKHLWILNVAVATFN
jgi:hypothetical protein